MPSFTNLTTRFLIVLTGAAFGSTLLPAAASASPASSEAGNPTAACDGTHHSDTGHGANHRGAYDETCDGSPSGNGNGGGEAAGKPCAGCVGNADDKNPQGQASNGHDHNAGYECDRNHGVGRTNPAHTGCAAADTDPTSTGGNGGGRGTSGSSAPKPPKDPAVPKGPKGPDAPKPPSNPRGDDVPRMLEPTELHVAPNPPVVADPATDARVLGVSFTRQDVAVLGAETARSSEGSLPITGGHSLDPAALALALVALGTVLRRVGRRPVGDRVW